MTKASNISFYSLFDAGFLSAETYRALNPKKRLVELNFSECDKYPKAVSKELKRLFEDDNLIDVASKMEYIERDLATDYPSSIESLSRLLEDAPAEIKTIIRKVGDRAFLSRYALCTSDVLSRLSFITDNNIELVETFRKNFIGVYFTEEQTNRTKKLSIIHPAVNSLVVEEPKIFYGKDNIKIEDDAVVASEYGNLKYVKYVFSLDAIQFRPFERKIEEALESYPVRLGNSVRFVGYRAFYVNYLYAEDTKLLKLRNFGKKSLQDCNHLRSVLREFVMSYYNETQPSEEKQVNKEKITIKELLGSYKYSILVESLHSLIRERSTRVQNVIAGMSDDDFIEYYVHHDGNLKHLRNIGKHSTIELEEIISRLRDEIKSLDRLTVTDDDMTWLKMSSVYGNSIDSFSEAFYKKHGHLPMIHILSNILLSMLSIRNFEIINEVRPFDERITGKTYEEVGTIYDLSRERVRQICNYCVEYLLQEPTSQVKPNTPFNNIVSRKGDWDYIHDFLLQKMVWRKEDFSAVATEECSTLSTDYIITVLANIYRDEYSIIGKAPILNQQRNVTWRNTFMVKTELTKVFDFDKMWNIITDLINDTVGSVNYSSQELVLDAFNEAWIELDVTYLTEIERATIEVLINEFGIIPEIEGNIIFTGKKQIDTADALYEILKDKGDPITLEDLFNEFDELCPGRYKSATSIRHIISKDARMYVISNTNLVSLYEWEHVAMGSIRDLIVEFLAEHNEPQPLAAIIAHIKSLRETTDNSIRSTMGTGDQFQQFQGGFYGLSDRAYPEWFYLSELERNARKNIDDLERFIDTNHHFPFSQSSDANENRLYLWYAKMKRSKDLSEHLASMISSLEEKYAATPRVRSEYQWVQDFQKYKSFVLQNNRKPSKSFPNESFLNKWFEKTLNLLTDNRLTVWQVKMFYELCGLL